MLVHSNTTTSREAALRMEGSPAATARQQVLDCIVAAGVHGRTRAEIKEITGLEGDTIRPRIDELKDDGAIELSDEVRRNSKGRIMEVLVATGAHR